MREVVHCLKCPRTVDYADLTTLHEAVAIAEIECVLADGPCWLAWAEREGYLCDLLSMTSPLVSPPGPRSDLNGDKRSDASTT